MKIVVVSGGFKKFTTYALPWKYAYEISRGLIKRGHNVHILTDTTNSYVLHNANECKIPVVGCGPFPNFLSTNSRVKHFSKIVASLDPDAIYYFTSPIGDFTLRSWKPEKQLILHISHNIQGLYTYFRGNIASMDMARLLKGELFANSLALALMFKRVTLDRLEFKLINTSTEAIKENLIKIGFNPSKIKTLPLVVDELFLEYKGKENNIQNVCDPNNFGDSFTAVYFGACNHKRGILELIKAVPILKRRIHNFKLLLLFRPPATRNFMIIIKKLIQRTKCHEDIVIEDELLAPNSLLKILSRSDVVILPYKYLDEEPPLTLLEAMALGKVVITTDLSCIKNIVGRDRGIVLDSVSPPSIAQAMCDCYFHPSKRKSIEKNAKEFAKANFANWDGLANTIEKQLLPL